LRHLVAAADTTAGYVARGRDAFDRDPVVRGAILIGLRRVFFATSSQCSRPKQILGAS
jgi:hypothetical protein